MALVTSPTLPWSAEQLDLHNPARWKTICPLLRPSVVAVRAAKGQTVLVDKAITSGHHVEIALIGPASSIPSYFAPGRSIAAIVTETAGAGVLTGEDVHHVLVSNGIKCEHGVVVLRLGRESKVHLSKDGLLEVDVRDELEFDHALAFFESARETARSSLHHMGELFKHFLGNATSTRTKFSADKNDKSPAVVHEHGDAIFESAKKALRKDLEHVMRSGTATYKDHDVVYSIHYSDINGLSQLENYILAFEIATYLDSLNLPYRLSSSPLLDSKDPARGWALSVCPVARTFLYAQSKPSNPLQDEQSPASASTIRDSKPASIKFDDAAVRKRIVAACESVIKEEPRITEYDTIVGDGDCGFTLRDGAQKVLEFIRDKDLADLPHVVATLVDDLEVTMGGTSGALYCIYLSSLAQALQTCSSVPAALSHALAHLLNYTRARMGDRTMLDTLIPFCETLESTNGDGTAALEKAREGMERTSQLKASLGRSTYLDDSKTRGVPDPGAYGLLCLLEGMVG